LSRHENHPTPSINQVESVLLKLADLLEKDQEFREAVVSFIKARTRKVEAETLWRLSRLRDPPGAKPRPRWPSINTNTGAGETTRDSDNPLG